MMDLGDLSIYPLDTRITALQVLAQSDSLSSKLNLIFASDDASPISYQQSSPPIPHS